MVTEHEIEAAAAAIANARGMRRGAPKISNILRLLQGAMGGKLYDEVMEDARAALNAAEQIRAQESNREGPGVESPAAEGH